MEKEQKIVMGAVIALLLAAPGIYIALRPHPTAQAGFPYKTTTARVLTLTEPKSALPPEGASKAATQVGAVKAMSELPKEWTLDCGNGATLKLVLIPAGEFMMGGDDDAVQYG
jgi:hypothetical protein